VPIDLHAPEMTAVDLANAFSISGWRQPGIFGARGDYAPECLLSAAPQLPDI
jgi:hypothetical protein